MKNDFTGARFGRLTVIAPTEQRNRGTIVWRCRCDCGKEVLVDSRKLSAGAVRSCGCDEPDYAAIKDLTGMRFGRLVVLGKSGNRAKDRNPLWRCRCDCGKEMETTKRRLITGAVSSCGCARTPPMKDLAGKRFGRVVVEEYAGKANGFHMWRCRCDCGTEFTTRQSNLENGQTTSCGCKHRDRSGLHFVDGTFVEGIDSMTVSKANTSGVRGVYFNKRRGKWIAQIVFKGKCYYLGGYDKLEDAAKARAVGEEMYDQFLEWYHASREPAIK
ncbi:MAG: hypothetical protein ACI4O6_09695 [Dysosmobacter sp.]